MVQNWEFEVPVSRDQLDVAGSETARSVGERPVFDDTTRELVDTAIVDRDALGSGDVLAGPAILEELDTTIVVPSGWAAVADDHGNLILSRVAG